MKKETCPKITDLVIEQQTNQRRSILFENEIAVQSILLCEKICAQECYLKQFRFAFIKLLVDNLKYSHRRAKH